MTDERNTIEHNRHEAGGKRHSKTYLIWCWFVLAGGWILNLLSSNPFDWVSVGFGFMAGVFFIVTAYELLGPDLPAWMRR
ncbi:MAG: hypothetical protein MnENMB40S_28870 [Rhizobiaceae bacterium MnEN-MB40S]|nr:MAG: hypothetical protein MnENMB40S_28870 [Rhizobiaceae bacterium MnEN-MB40S]